MNETLFPLTEAQTAERDAFVERILQATAGAFTIFTLYIGYKLGFYGILVEHGSMTSVDLAALTDMHERYVREWLEQQTVASILQVANHDTSPTQRSFHLPAPHAEVLTDENSPNYVLPPAPMMAGVVRPLLVTICSLPNRCSANLALMAGHYVRFGGNWRRKWN